MYSLLHLAATTEGLHTGQAWHSGPAHAAGLSPEWRPFEHFAASIEGGESDVRHGHQTLALALALTFTPTLPLTKFDVTMGVECNRGASKLLTSLNGTRLHLRQKILEC